MMLWREAYKACRDHCEHCSIEAMVLKIPSIQKVYVKTLNQPGETPITITACRMCFDWLLECDDAPYDEARVMARIDRWAQIRGT